MQQHNLRCGGQPNIGFVGNLLLFAAVKEFCKSIKNPVVDAERMGPRRWLVLVLCVPISALTPMVGWWEDIQPIKTHSTNPQRFCSRTGGGGGPQRGSCSLWLNWWCALGQSISSLSAGWLNVAHPEFKGKGEARLSHHVWCRQEGHPASGSELKKKSCPWMQERSN